MFEKLMALKANDPKLWIATLVAGVLTYSFTTFATIDYVDKKHVEVRQDQADIKKEVSETKALVYEIKGMVKSIKDDM